MIRNLARLAHGPAAPWLAGAASLGVVLFVWGSLSPPAAIHDEASYLLQGRLFADGRWAAPSPPLPEFFEQLHVLVVPAFASKYPPGHALALAAGIAAGFPAAVPLLATGVTGGLLFALARRSGGAATALLAWALWLAAPANLDFRASYLSETTSSALWMMGWACLARWRDRGGAAVLAGVSAAIGLCAVTRPLTAVAFAVPIGILLLRDHRRLSGRGAAAALGPAVLVLGLLPAWSAATTGDWRRTPLLVYTGQYMPYDVPGFGPVAAGATRALPSDLDALNRVMARHRAERRIADLPEIAVRRAGDLAGDLWGRAAFGLAPFFVLGLFVLRGEGRFAVATSVLLFLLYLSYWHDRLGPADRPWTVYALEALPALAYATAVGIRRAAAFAADRLARTDPDRAARVLRGITAVAAAVVLELLAFRAAAVRSAKERRLAGPAAFRALRDAIPDARAVVFVRYAPGHDPHRSLVSQFGDPRTERVWAVHDRGAENARLQARAPDRAAYLYDEARGRLVRLPPPL